MANVVDSLAWDEDLVRARTKLADADAAELQAFFTAAKEAADEYLNNPFIDEDEADVALPTRVELGVYALTRLEYQAALEGRDDSVQSVKTHMLAVTYRTDADATDSLGSIQNRYWAPYRLQPGF